MFVLICDVTKDAILIDPSFQNPFEFATLKKYFDGGTTKTKKDTPRVAHILLTHGHSDHVVGVTDAMKYWPDATLHLHPLEEENYRLASEVGLQFGLHLPHRLPTPTHELKDGEVLKVGESIELTVIHTPGHSPGHVAFADRRPVIPQQRGTIHDQKHVGGEEEEGLTGDNGNVLISGDLLFNGSVGRTDFHNASVEDLYASLRRIYDLCDDGSIVLSGHTTPTYLKRERQSNPFVDLALRRPDAWYEEAKERLDWDTTTFKR
jgi:hydroxyacylglutathione hydrolase